MTAETQVAPTPQPVPCRSPMTPERSGHLLSGSVDSVAVHSHFAEPSQIAPLPRSSGRS